MKLSWRRRKSQQHRKFDPFQPPFSYEALSQAPSHGRSRGQALRASFLYVTLKFAEVQKQI